MRTLVYQLAAFVFLTGAVGLALVTMAFEEPHEHVPARNRQVCATVWCSLRLELASILATRSSSECCFRLTPPSRVTSIPSRLNAATMARSVLARGSRRPLSSSEIVTRLMSTLGQIALFPLQHMPSRPHVFGGDSIVYMRILPLF
jgi:hypothetical protein